MIKFDQNRVNHVKEISSTATVEDDKNKVYSIDVPKILCISKGKEHKQYEFGNKSSFVPTSGSGIIVGAMAIDANAYDGHTLKPQLE